MFARPVLGGQMGDSRVAIRRLVFSVLAAAGFSGTWGGELVAETTWVSQIRDSHAQSGLIAAQEGLALGGYDVVSFHDSGTPQPGQAAYELMWKGAVWRFASAANLARFEQDPRRFEPRFGGYCALAMARGRLAQGDPLTWELRDGRLYFFHSTRAEHLWQGDAADLIVAADAAWPGVLRGKP